MSTLKKTGLESAVLSRFHQLYQEQGFPPAEAIDVMRRLNTGGGRYVDLYCEVPLRVEDGYLDLRGGYIAMKGVPNGMMAVVLVKDGRVTMLEFTVYGNDSWYGEENSWEIV